MAERFDRSIAFLLDCVPGWITPNGITLFATSLAVPMVYVSDEHPWSAVSLLVASRLLDAVDGPLARRRGVTTAFGAVLDAFCDKVWLAIALWGISSRIHVAFSIVVLAMELVLVAMRPVKKRFGATLKSNPAGGIKMWMQSFAVAFVLTKTAWGEALAPATFVFAIFCAILSLILHVQDIQTARAAKNRTA